MILTGSEITRQVRQGRITITPFSTEQVNPNSYNYRLGEWITVCRGNTGDGGSPVIRIPDQGFLLMPRQLYLGHTAEKIGSRAFVTSLIGRSSMGRLGLFLQISADLGNLGPAHSWTLELFVVQPLRIYAGMKIGQVSFWRPTGTIELYSGSYTDYSMPTHCVVNDLKAMAL
jgi:dCTP deaminase